MARSLGGRIGTERQVVEHNGSKIGQAVNLLCIDRPVTANEQAQRRVGRMLAVAAVFDVTVVAGDEDERAREVGLGNETAKEAVEALQHGDRRRQSLIVAINVGHPVLEEEKVIRLCQLPQHRPGLNCAIDRGHMIAEFVTPPLIREI